MKTLFALFGLIILVTFCTRSAHAVEITVSWQLPGQYSDGTTVQAGDIVGIEVDYGTCAGDFFGEVIGKIIILPSESSATFDLPPGGYCFQVIAITGEHGNTTSFPAFLSLFGPKAPFIEVI